jgi:hypothetical protein
MGPSPRTTADCSEISGRINHLVGRTTADCTIPRVVRITRILTRRAGAFGLAMTAWDIWRRIPPKHRRTILNQARKHGPTLAKQAVEYRRKRRR